MMTNTNSNTRPGFRAKFTWGVEGSILWLKDEGTECRSLTNDLENCLVEVSAQLPTGTSLTDYHIIYRDSEGDWDAIAITELKNVAEDRKLLLDYNTRGRDYCVRGLRFKFFPIQQTKYSEAVNSVVSGKMYRHFNLPIPRIHNLN